MSSVVLVIAVDPWRGVVGAAAAVVVVVVVVVMVVVVTDHLQAVDAVVTFEGGPWRSLLGAEVTD